MALYAGRARRAASADNEAGNPIISWAATPVRQADLGRGRREQVGEPLQQPVGVIGADGCEDEHSVAKLQHEANP
jgi:hypothetical protein